MHEKLQIKCKNVKKKKKLKDDWIGTYRWDNGFYENSTSKRMLANSVMFDTLR